MRTYKLIGEGLNQVLEMTEADGTIRYVPMDESNSDYQAYLNPVEHLTEILTPDEA